MPRTRSRRWWWWWWWSIATENSNNNNARASIATFAQKSSRKCNIRKLGIHIDAKFAKERKRETKQQQQKYCSVAEVQPIYLLCTSIAICWLHFSHIFFFFSLCPLLSKIINLTQQPNHTAAPHRQISSESVDSEEKTQTKHWRALFVYSKKMPNSKRRKEY